jgi:DNA invertase Pin-like site-specific DNA recombinase
MKNKQVLKFARLTREPHVDGLTLSEQIDSLLAQSHRQVMSERIKAGLARKRDRDVMSIKGRNKRYDYNVTRTRQPNPIKTRN